MDTLLTHVCLDFSHLILFVKLLGVLLEKIDLAVKKCLGNAGLHWVFNVHCDSLRSWYTIFSISQINLTWRSLLKNFSPITSALITHAGKFLYTYYPYLIAFSDIFSEDCFEHTACKIIFLFLDECKIILINFKIFG